MYTFAVNLRGKFLPFLHVFLSFPETNPALQEHTYKSPILLQI